MEAYRYVINVIHNCDELFMVLFTNTADVTNQYMESHRYVMNVIHSCDELFMVLFYKHGRRHKPIDGII